MIMIKIKKNSIRKNPNAGRTSFMAVGPIEIKFKITGKGIPEELSKYCEVTDWTEPYSNTIPGNGTERTLRKVYKPGIWEGYIVNPDHVKHFQNKKYIDDPHLHIEIRMNQQQQIIHSAFPEPKYLFHYEKKNLICSACRTKIPVDKIEIDYNEDEIEYEICPSCGAKNTFSEHQYESVEDAMTRKS